MIQRIQSNIIQRIQPCIKQVIQSIHNTEKTVNKSVHSRIREYRIQGVRICIVLSVHGKYRRI